MPEAVVPATPAAATTPAAPVVAPKGRFELPPEEPKAPPAAAASEVVTPAQNTEEQAPSTPEGETPQVADTPEQAAERERKREGARYGRKLDKAYRQRAEAQARAEFLEKQLAAATTASAPKAEGEPKLADFDYDPEKYAAAVRDHTKKQAEKEQGEKQRTAAQQAEHQRLVSAWEEKVDKGSEKYDDWNDVVGEIQPDSHFTATIIDADNGHDVAHYLGKHPKEAERIAKLQPRQQVFEIGKLSAKLAATPEKPKVPSKAPAPITPLSGAAPVVPTEPSEADDMKTWMKKRNKQVYGRGN